MKKDIDNTEDILLLVNEFYKSVLDDSTIGFIFKDLAGFSFEKHIPIMVSFWNTLLFGSADYKGNPMVKHLELNKIFPLENKHFKQWLTLWADTVHQNFEGVNATEAILKAKNIAAIMELKCRRNLINKV